MSVCIEKVYIEKGRTRTLSTGRSISSTLPLMSVTLSDSPFTATISRACSMIVEQSTPITSLTPTSINVRRNAPFHLP